MFEGVSEEEMEIRSGIWAGERVAEAVKKVKGKKTAKKMAEAAYAAIREMSAEIGQKPDIETMFKTPEESHDYQGGQPGIYIVCWESGPYEWAYHASMAITSATGKLCEPYWSFSLNFYPQED